MPRRKITSTTKKKADQKLKRSIKRGEAPPPEPNLKKKKVSHRLKRRIAPSSNPTDPATIESARKLQSAFIKLPPEFLEQTKQLASRLPLLRPIPNEKAIFHSFDHTDEPDFDALACPKRPKWSFDMSKLEVERNEEGLFKKYLLETDKALGKWQNKTEPSESDSQEMPRSPSYFERNPEIWRQLWRVTEISQIILVLLDSRCPILHYPPSLSSYLSDRKVILVLTKVDISGPVRVQAWINYLQKHYPDSHVVQVESYVEKDVSSDHQGHKQQEPSIPKHFRADLVAMLKKVHEELLVPPDTIASNPDKLKNWIPPVKREISWDGVLQAKGTKVGVAVGDVLRPHSPSKHEDPQDSRHQLQEPNYLTIGLIGQPNVGKSSLLNALFGARRVRASKTPGKTKHFQTLYWTPDVRLVDCPGLVMPNYVPMEMQILCGIYPISRVSGVPSCIYYASQLLPLERIFKLPHPSTKLPPAEDKRTWRDNKPRDGPQDPETPPWTAMEILTTYADAKGWVTAKSGRVDIHRAGNAILRSLAEGRVGWAFWPPGTPLDEIAAAGGEGQGIWIPRADGREDRSEWESDDDEPEENANPLTPSEDEEEEDSDLSEDGDIIDATPNVGLGRFNALSINEVDDEDEDDEEEEEESE